MTNRIEKLKRKAKKYEDKVEDIVSTPEAEESKPRRKRGQTHYGMAVVATLRKQNEEAAQEIERLKSELNALIHSGRLSPSSGAAGDLDAVASGLEKGGAIVELDPDAIQVVKHDRSDASLKTEGFTRLVDSIREAGQVVPIIVRKADDGRLELVAGYRRLNACKQLGRPVKAVVISANDKDTAVYKAVENHVREDLNVFERAQSYHDVVKVRKLMSARALARLLGISPPSVTQYLRVMAIPEPVRRILMIERMGQGASDEVLSIETPKLKSLVRLALQFESLDEAQLKKVVQAVESAVQAGDELLLADSPEKRAKAVEDIIARMKGNPAPDEREQPKVKRIVSDDGKVLCNIKTSNRGTEVDFPHLESLPVELRLEVIKLVKQLESLAPKEE